MSKRQKLFLEASILINLMLITFVVVLAVREKPPETIVVTRVVGISAVTQIAPTNTPSPELSTDTPQPTFTPTATEIPTETAVPPTATYTPLPTNTSTPTQTPPPTDTPTPIPTDTPIPLPTLTPLPPQPWLTYLNDLRQIGNLPPLLENANLTAGSGAHSLYMVKTDEVTRGEAEDSPFYTDMGASSGSNAIIFTTVTTVADFEWAINYWFSMPFHALSLLDPRLQKVGYGQHVEEIGSVNMAATLDIYSAPRATAAADLYPIFYPADGSHVWITRQSQFESPDPLSSCDFERPSGPPIIVQLGSGDMIPDVTTVTLQRGPVLLDVCYFDETSYVNTNLSAQTMGRDFLDAQDAIIIIPMAELTFGPAYTVTLEVNGIIYTWSFDVQVRSE